MHYCELFDQVETFTELVIHLLFKNRLGKALFKKGGFHFNETKQVHCLLSSCCVQLLELASVTSLWRFI